MTGDMQHGGTKPREPARSGAEQDVVSRYWRRMCCYLGRPGVAAWIKRAIRRRERRGAIPLDDDSVG
ncbi:putative glycosyltransferase [Mizugakiibacter sediminis]|uniref:Putative glycosyltransferase n=1 Tax=Mizugakiibacter sediminis TaxID=1475481 RepID=A0A0K8QSL6_9GAMM|nr:putative glycosyltransferase [Mizugakiibacter sediminis]